MKLRHLSCIILRNALNVPGRLKTPQHIFAAGLLIESQLEKIRMPEPDPEKDAAQNAAAQDAWSVQTTEITVTASQREACALALNAAIEGGQFPPSAYLNELLVAFEIVKADQ